ncbi:hypothetical protein VNO80_16547 [Phaseolus coccineus]|uniref:Uncharacterized protein n=1 Tax=Phaseolus coccineus TaxID=3886 RepID=A0AAN9MTH7_PHACN
MPPHEGVFAITIILRDVLLSTTSLGKKKASTLDVVEAMQPPSPRSLGKMGVTFKNSNLVTVKRAEGHFATPPPVKHAKVLPGSLPSTIDSSRVSNGIIPVVDITSSQQQKKTTRIPRPPLQPTLCLSFGSKQKSYIRHWNLRWSCIKKVSMKLGKLPKESIEDIEAQLKLMEE